MDNFCRYCGARMNKKLGYCPYCFDRAGNDIRFMGSNPMNDNYKNNKSFSKIIMSIFLIVFIGALLVFGLNYFDIVNLNAGNSPKTTIKEYSYLPSENSISKDESGVHYINNTIIIFFEKNISNSEADEVINSINGKVVGKIPSINQYQIEIQPNTLEGINEICDNLKQNDSVYEAIYDQVVAVDTNVISDSDPWRETGMDKNILEWSKKNPEKKDWWKESVGLEKKGKYDRLSNSEIGIIASGFDNSRADYGKSIMKILNDGIKKKGLGSFFGRSKFYTWDFEANSIDSLNISNNFRKVNTLNQLMSETVNMVENGVKIIDFSVGNFELISDYERNNQGYNTSIYLNRLLEENYDFLIVQPSGNGILTDDNIRKAVPSNRNGFFTSIEEKNCAISDAFSYKDIRDRIIVVGAAQNSGNNSYKQLEFSNGGEGVDITAPGEAYIKRKGENGEKQLIGTSTSATIVTGIASIIWDLNESLSASDLKRIICDNRSSSLSITENENNQEIVKNRLINLSKSINNMESVLNSKKNNKKKEKAEVEENNKEIEAEVQEVEIEEPKKKELTEEESINLLKQSSSKEILDIYYQDFDSDGTKEAFITVGNQGLDPKFPAQSDVDIYFVNSDGVVLLKEDMFGFCPSLINLGKYTFYCYEKTGGGSRGITQVFGVRNGKVEEMNISNKYGDFMQDEVDNSVSAYHDYFTDFGHQYDFYYFHFDENTFSFIQGERKPNPWLNK